MRFMADDLIRYDVLVSDALRGVVRQVLTEIAATGLPGEHHFYITIDTRMPGVRISSALRQRFPEEMTVVLQRLLIPFSAVTGFADPSVDFALKFETVVVDAEDMVGEPAAAVDAEVEEASDAPVHLPRAGTGGPQRIKAEDDDADEKSADVVSLDAFRKKN